jgi:hypothetical protein
MNMNQLWKALIGLAAGVLLGMSPVANADINRDLPTISAPVAGAATVTEEQPAPRAKRYTIRMRLDDGRYRGFRQHGTDELRTDDRVIIENDRIQAERRARANGDFYR